MALKEKNKEKPSEQRYRNAQGQIIPMHHAFLTVQLDDFARATAFLLPAAFLVLIWAFLPGIVSVWDSISGFWMHRIYGVTNAHEKVLILGRELMIPYPILEAAPPTMSMVYMNLFVCVLVFLLSFLVPGKLAPMNYLIRAGLLIQASASLDRLISPEFFPYTLKIYIVDSLSLALYLVFLLPAMLGFVYYIFDFGVVRKVALTIMMVGYFIIVIPCQYTLHAYVVYEWSLLFLPLMYLLFGTLLDVLMFISIYAFGMSWHDHAAAMQGRGL